MMASGSISNTSITAAADVAVIEVGGRERTNIEFAVAGAALTAFTVEYLFAPSSGSTYQMMANAAADFTAPGVNDPVRGASADLTTAAVGEQWLVLDTRGVWKVRIRASSGGTASVVGTWSAA